MIFKIFNDQSIQLRCTERSEQVSATNSWSDGSGVFWLQISLDCSQRSMENKKKNNNKNRARRLTFMTHRNDLN